jgi:hypothetical protein
MRVRYPWVPVPMGKITILTLVLLLSSVLDIFDDALQA